MRSLNIGWGAALLAIAACATGNTGNSGGEPASNVQTQPLGERAGQPLAVTPQQPEAVHPFAGQPRTTQRIAPGVNAGGPGLAGPPPGDGQPTQEKATPPDGVTQPPPGTKSGSERVEGDELAAACSGLCKKAAACAPKEAHMSEDICAKSCTAVPGGEAKRVAVERMKICTDKSDCAAFSTCMAGGRASATPPPAPGAH